MWQRQPRPVEPSCSLARASALRRALIPEESQKLTVLMCWWLWWWPPGHRRVVGRRADAVGGVVGGPVGTVVVAAVVVVIFPVWVHMPVVSDSVVQAAWLRLGPGSRSGGPSVGAVLLGCKASPSVTATRRRWAAAARRQAIVPLNTQDLVVRVRCHHQHPPQVHQVQGGKTGGCGPAAHRSSVVPGT